jgi:hypothetical protein
MLRPNGRQNDSIYPEQREVWLFEVNPPLKDSAQKL